MKRNETLDRSPFDPHVAKLETLHDVIEKLDAQPALLDEDGRRVGDNRGDDARQPSSTAKVQPLAAKSAQQRKLRGVDDVARINFRARRLGDQVLRFVCFQKKGNEASEFLPFFT